MRVVASTDSSTARTSQCEDAKASLARQRSCVGGEYRNERSEIEVELQVYRQYSADRGESQAHKRLPQRRQHHAPKTERPNRTKAGANEVFSSIHRGDDATELIWLFDQHKFSCCYEGSRPQRIQIDTRRELCRIKGNGILSGLLYLINEDIHLSS
jgi:hypothetical protein